MNNLKLQMATVQDYAAEQASVGAARSCLAGFYLLTADGELARFGSGAEMVMEPRLTASLSSRLRAVLNQYRSGALEGLSLGLAADSGSEGAWGAGTIIFSDYALKELFDTDRSADMPLTLCEQRNRTRSLYRGMELLLNKKSSYQPLLSRFCPVLFVPEVGCHALCERYEAGSIDDKGLYEVLDLSAPFASNTRFPEELEYMVERMRDSQTETVCTSLDAVLLHKRDKRWETAELPRTAGLSEPSPDSGAGTCFEEGDPVTGWLLQWFSPFNELTDTQREIIAGYEVIRKFAAGTRLIDAGVQHDKCIYLVEGTLALSDPEGETIHVTGGTRRSKLPICALNPHAYIVTAVTDVSVVVFSQKLIRQINDITRTYTSVEQSGMSDVSTAAISNGVQAAYLNRTLLSLDAEIDRD